MEQEKEKNEETFVKKVVQTGKTDPQAAGAAQHTDADGRIHRNEKTH